MVASCEYSHHFYKPTSIKQPQKSPKRLASQKKDCGLSSDIYN